jgi:hypothetical protein
MIYNLHDLQTLVRHSNLYSLMLSYDI